MNVIALLWLGCGGPPAPSAPVPAEVPAPPVPPPAPPTPVVEPLPSAGPFTREVLPGLVVSAFDLPDVEGTFDRPDPAALAGVDPRIWVVTVDPARFEVVYRSALDPAVGGEARPADRWAADQGLVLAWNPGMFEPDGRATGYTRSGAFTSQPDVRRNALYASWFWADAERVGMLHFAAPKAKGTYIPLASLPADRRAALDAHPLVAQSLTILHEGRRAYPPRRSHWSELAYGVDRDGRVAVVFTRWPMEMRELGARLEALDVGLLELLHGEGGPEASLVLRAGGVSLDLCGSYETGFYDDSNRHLWSLPAVMGARAR